MANAFCLSLLRYFQSTGGDFERFIELNTLTDDKETDELISEILSQDYLVSSPSSGHNEFNY